MEKCFTDIAVDDEVLDALDTFVQVIREAVDLGKDRIQYGDDELDDTADEWVMSMLFIEKSAPEVLKATLKQKYAGPPLSMSVFLTLSLNLLCLCIPSSVSAFLRLFLHSFVCLYSLCLSLHSCVCLYIPIVLFLSLHFFLCCSVPSSVALAYFFVIHLLSHTSLG